MMRTVVAGARGYLGRALVQQLAEVGEVVALGRADSGGQFVDHLSGRVDDIEAHLEGADAAINLAGKLVTDRNATVAEYLEANLVFADMFAGAAVESGVGRLVHASSRLVYPSTMRAPAREDYDAEPDTAYGLSKKWAEDAVRVRTAGSNTSAISLRIAQVTGGSHGGLGVINTFVSQARRTGAVSVSGAGDAVREVIHVNDVARAIIAALSYEGPWLPVNIGGTTSVTIWEVATEIARLAGGVPVVRSEADPGDSSVYALDHTRCERVLGWRAKVSWRDIIAEVWARAEEAEK